MKYASMYGPYRKVIAAEDVLVHHPDGSLTMPHVDVTLDCGHHFKGNPTMTFPVGEMTPCSDCMDEGRPQ